MTNPDFLTMAISDIVASQENMPAFAEPTVELMVARNFQRALAEAYRQHTEFLGSWVFGRIHECDHDLLTQEHRDRVRALFSVIGVGEATIDLLIEAEFSTKPLYMRTGTASSTQGR